MTPCTAKHHIPRRAKDSMRYKEPHPRPSLKQLGSTGILPAAPVYICVCVYVGTYVNHSRLKPSTTRVFTPSNLTEFDGSVYHQKEVTISRKCQGLHVLYHELLHSRPPEMTRLHLCCAFGAYYRYHIECVMVRSYRIWENFIWVSSRRKSRGMFYLIPIFCLFHMSDVSYRAHYRKRNPSIFSICRILV